MEIAENKDVKGGNQKPQIKGQTRTYDHLK